jgi:hypothetical protein
MLTFVSFFVFYKFGDVLMPHLERLSSALPDSVKDLSRSISCVSVPHVILALFLANLLSFICTRTFVSMSDQHPQAQKLNVTLAARRKSVKGKLVLVTGGASGLGLLLAKKFLKAGARVVICDLRPVFEILFVSDATGSSTSGQDGVEGQFRLGQILPLRCLLCRQRPQTCGFD